MTVLLELERTGMAVLDRVAKPVQRPDTRVAPQEKINFRAQPTPIIWS